MIENFLVNSTLINAPVFVDELEDKVITDVILGDKFPWYWQNYQILDDDETTKNKLPVKLRDHITFHNGPFLGHSLLHRAISETEKYTERPIDHTSIYWRMFLEIFDRFTIENNIKYTNIFRANLNLTWYNSDVHTAPHLDHEWPHNNFIMYLTDCTDGETIIWPDDFSTSYLVNCKKYTAVTFKHQWHAQRYPALGTKRIAFVLTYI